MSALSEFADVLRLERLRRRIKQGDLAAQLGVTQSALCGWERGDKRPVDEHLRSWAKALGIEVPDGVGGGVPAPCGTEGARARHRRNGEPNCDRCRIAHTESMRTYRERLRAPQ